MPGYDRHPRNTLGPVDMDRPLLDHPLNAGRVLWLYGGPGVAAGGGRWPDLCGKYPATLVTGYSWSPVPYGPHGLTTSVASVSVTLPTLTLGPNDSAFGCWVRHTGTVGNSHLACTSGSSDNRLFWLSTTTFRLQTASGTRGFAVPAVAAGEWNRYLLVRANGISRLYVNGRESSTGGLADASAVPITRLFAFAAAGSGAMDSQVADVGGWSGRAFPEPAGFAAADYTLSRRDYPGVLRRQSRASWLVGGGAGVTGTAGGTLPLAGTGAGSVMVQGVGVGTLPLGGGGAGVVAVSGAGAGTLPLTGTATGTVLVQGVGSGTLPLGGSASGRVPVQGIAAGTLPLTGVATGTAAVSGSAAGTLPLSGTATGTVGTPQTVFPPVTGSLSLRPRVTGTFTLRPRVTGTFTLRPV